MGGKEAFSSPQICLLVNPSPIADFQFVLIFSCCEGRNKNFQASYTLDQKYLQLFKKLPNCFPKALYTLNSHQQYRRILITPPGLAGWGNQGAQSAIFKEVPTLRFWSPFTFYTLGTSFASSHYWPCPPHSHQNMKEYG